MKKLLLYLFLFFTLISKVFAQELFTYTEPASNMAKGTLGFRLNSTIMKDEVELKNNVQFMPEIMLGISKKWMIHFEGFVSDRNNNIIAEGGSFYTKYRFYSSDDVHSHFRMAAFSKLALNNSEIHQHAIDLNGHNSGYELGWVATALQHKVAISGSVSFLHALDNRNMVGYEFYNESRNAINYTLSTGKLMLPKKYKDYKQTNLNAMIEILGQTNINLGNSFIDCGPVLQLIFLSKMRLDCSYRFPLYNELHRTATNGFLIRFEYNVFNAF